MSVTCHTASIATLLESIAEPYIVFNDGGAVTFANRVAKALSGNPAVTLSGTTMIKTLLEHLKLGKIKLPYPTHIKLPDGLLEGQFIPGLIGTDIAFIGQKKHDANATMPLPASAPKPTPVQEPTVAPPLDSEPDVHSDAPMLGLKEIISLLRDELNPHMQKLSQQLQALNCNEEQEALAESAKALNDRLLRLADLVAVFGDDIAIAHDRLELVSVLQELCAEIEPRATKVGVSFQITESTETLPPIYGNERLIRRAFYECLDNALTHSRKEVNNHQMLLVEIRFTMSGEHVLVSLQNRGATGLKINSKDKLKPFVAPLQKTTNPTAPVTKLGLPLVQRIVGLHGGNMRLHSDEDDLVNVKIELPTGAPQRAQNQLDVAQVQRYATDLAQLIALRKKEKS